MGCIADMNAAPRPLTYTNRRGHDYYLHAGTTKTGKPRYFVAKTVGDGALAELPAGFEIIESINGVVSVRRVDPRAPTVPEVDLARVRAELGRHSHLRRHRADAVKGEIIVFEPVGGLRDEVPTRFASELGRRRPQDEQRTRYAPVVRLVPGEGRYAMFRVTYRGAGGWSWPLGRGTVEELVSKHLNRLGTDAFFELY